MPTTTNATAKGTAGPAPPCLPETAPFPSTEHLSMIVNNQYPKFEPGSVPQQRQPQQQQQPFGGPIPAGYDPYQHASSSSTTSIPIVAHPASSIHHRHQQQQHYSSFSNSQSSASSANNISFPTSLSSNNSSSSYKSSSYLHPSSSNPNLNNNHNPSLAPPSSHMSTSPITVFARPGEPLSPSSATTSSSANLSKLNPADGANAHVHSTVPMPFRGADPRSMSTLFQHLPQVEDEDGGGIGASGSMDLGVPSGWMDDPEPHEPHLSHLSHHPHQRHTSGMGTVDGVMVWGS
jgi:hypothetical protein